MGYHRAGFEVIGVDLDPQPFYPFEFFQRDALDLLADCTFGATVDFGTHGVTFDAIHASPPCQRYSEMNRRWPGAKEKHPDLIAPTRELLISTGLPYVIENVMGAAKELRDAVVIEARSLGGTELARARLFETNWFLMVPPRVGKSVKVTIGVYGDRPDGRELNSRYPGTTRAANSLEEAQRIMGMDWADWHGTKEAIPPDYTELIGYQLLTHVRSRAVAA